MDKQVETTENSTREDLRADGERFMPDMMRGTIVLEHLHRYELAAGLVKGLVVLDIASGEGYGSAVLARQAERVIGVDIAPEAIQHAQTRYGHERLSFMVGECAAIPLDDHSVDVVVSFETIEHHDQHEQMLAEIKRVLRPKGLLVMSSPDKLEYTEKSGMHNQFHVKELYEAEFKALIRQHFSQSVFHGQRVLYGSAIDGSAKAGSPSYRKMGSNTPAVRHLPNPQYWIALASDGPLPAVEVSFLEEPAEARLLEARNEKRGAMAAAVMAVASADSLVLQAALTSPWYLAENADVAASGMDPVEHWLERGVVECRQPAPDVPALVRDLAEERQTRALAAAEQAMPSEALLGAALPALLSAQHALESQLRERADLERRHADALATLKVDHAAQLAAATAKHQEQLQAAMAERAGLEAKLHAMDQAHQRALADIESREQAAAQAAQLQLQQARSEGVQALESLRKEHLDREREVFDRLLKLQADLQAEAARRDTASQELAGQLRTGQEQVLAHLAATQTAHQEDGHVRWQALSQHLDRSNAQATSLIDQLSKEAVQREQSWLSQFTAMYQAAREERQAQLGAFEGRLQDLADKLRQAGQEDSEAQRLRFERLLEQASAQAVRREEAILHNHVEQLQQQERWWRDLQAQRDGELQREREASAARMGQLERQLLEAGNHAAALVSRHSTQFEQFAQQSAEKLAAHTSRLEQDRASILAQHRAVASAAAQQLIDLQASWTWRWAARLSRLTGGPSPSALVSPPAQLASESRDIQP